MRVASPRRVALLDLCGRDEREGEARGRELCGSLHARRYCDPRGPVVVSPLRAARSWRVAACAEVDHVRQVANLRGVWRVRGTIIERVGRWGV